MKGMNKTLKSGFGFDTRIFSLLFVFSFIVVIAISLILKYWGKGEFFEGITVEVFGMLFDIAVLGILYSIFKNRDENKRNIKRYLEEIEDFRGWNEKEATKRIVGNIKRLLELGEENLPLERCFLRYAYLAGLDLQRANFKEATLHGANLEGANLWGANFCLANLKETILHGGNLKYADLQDANLKYAYLQGADLTGARGLTCEQLLEVKSLYGVVGLNPGLEARLKEQKPELFKEPKEETMKK